MERLGPVVATAAAPTAREAAQAARLARAAGADRVEVRLDLLAPGEDPSGLLPLAAEVPLLFSGSRDRVLEGEVPLLKRAQELGAWVDLPSTDDLPEDLFGLERERLVLSWHDFEGTPAALGGVLTRLKCRGAAAYKLVPTARDLPDALALLRLLEREGGRGDLAAFAMGAPGGPTRLLALAWGSCATYASAPGAASAAPGQPSLDDLLATFRPRTLRREDPLYALVGWPLTYTRTPSFFNPWLELAGLPGRYVPFPCTEPRVLLESGLPLRGLAVTIPHKEAPLRLTSRVSRLALECGACNTLVPEGLGWLAVNTDVYGVRRALHAVPKGAPYLLLGCGGASAAAAVALRGRGPGAVAGRDPKKTEAFARRFGLRAVPWDESGSTSWDLLVNATPVGREAEETPYPLDALRGRWVMDMVVRPGGTPLLRAAAAQGLEAVPGEAMLVPQAALQFRLWTGRRPP
jgi:3-dehydroquinate dehydratase / shikimate dehydrogenase